MTAVASTNSGLASSHRAHITRSIASLEAATVIAHASETGENRGPAVDGFARWATDPAASDIDDARARSQDLDAFLEARTGARVASIAYWGAGASSNVATRQTVELDITLIEKKSFGPFEFDVVPEIALSVFDTAAVGGGFESLAFSIELSGERVGDAHLFDDLEQARIFFSALTTIDIGTAGILQGSNPIPELRAIFDIVTGAGQSIEFGLAAVVVPEPSTGILVLVGLGILSIRRRVGLAARSADSAFPSNRVSSTARRYGC